MPTFIQSEVIPVLIETARAAFGLALTVELFDLLAWLAQ